MGTELLSEFSEQPQEIIAARTAAIILNFLIFSSKLHCCFCLYDKINSIIKIIFEKKLFFMYARPV